MTIPKKAACIGGGVIGAGWIARLAFNGVDVAVHDPAPEAKTRIEAVLEAAWRALGRLTTAPAPARGTVTFADTIEAAVADAGWIVESVPERLDLKQAVYAAIEAGAPREAVVASSTSGLLPTHLQAKMATPDRLIVAHPFNPVYLVPLVEVVGGERTAPETIETARAVLSGLGMKPLVVRKEIDAFVADRLLEAVWREALWLVRDDVATTEEIDDAIRFGFGLRWAQMGLFETYRIAGGDAGMRHFMTQFGPTLSWPWTKLTDVPDFTPELVDLIAGQSDAQSGARSIRDLERIRDDNLVAILHALKANDWGAGRTLAAYEDDLRDRASAGREAMAPMETFAGTVAPDWADYNGHMTESRYLQCFATATDAFLAKIGVDDAYVANGGSYVTAETHICHLAEAVAGDTIACSTQVLQAQGKRLRLFHVLRRADGTPLATGEHMILHMDLSARAACDPPAAIAEALRPIAEGHAGLPVPVQAGRAVGAPRTRAGPGA